MCADRTEWMQYGRGVGISFSLMRWICCVRRNALIMPKLKLIQFIAARIRSVLDCVAGNVCDIYERRVAFNLIQSL